MPVASESLAPPHAIAPGKRERLSGSSPKEFGFVDHTPPGSFARSASFVEFTPSRVFRALRRRWFFAILLGLLAAAIGGYAANELVTSSYTARTQVYFPPATGPDGRGDTAAFQRRQSALAKSRLILGDALQHPDVIHLPIAKGGEDSVTSLEKRLAVDFSSSPDLMRVSLSGPNQEELLSLLNAIRETYLRQGANKDTTEKTTSIVWLRKLIADDQVKLKSGQEAVAELAEEFKCPDIASVRVSNDNHRTLQSSLQLRRYQLEVERDGFLEAAKNLETSPPSERPKPMVRAAELNAAVERAISQDKEALAKKAVIEQLDKEIKEYERVSQEGSAPQGLIDRRKARNEAFEAIRKREAVIKADLAGQMQEELLRNTVPDGKTLAERVQDLKKQAVSYDAKLAVMDKEIAALEAVILKEVRGIQELDRRIAAATKIDDRVKASQARIEVLERELAMGNPYQAQTDEVAVITQVPNPRKKQLTVAGAIAVGFLAGLFGIAFLDLRRGPIDSTEGVDRRLKAGVVGWLPRVSPAELQALARPGAILAGSEQSELCDAADACRALLLKTLEGGSGKVIMVTSALAGEGKTSLASQLALSLGRAGYRTLLIDADIRRPSVHSMFNRTLSPGLADVLKRSCPLEKVFRRSPLPTLGILPAGKCDPREIVGLLQRRMESIIRKSRCYFEVIIIDTPPLDLPDGMVIGTFADGTVLSLMNEVSRLPEAQLACERLRAMNIPILGAVLNAARARHPRSY